MAEKSYKPTDIGSSARDWVRFQLGDTDIDTMVFDDTEIDAILVQECQNKWLAAAALGDIMLTTKSKGAIEKVVGDLRLRYGDEGDESNFGQHLRRLREDGAANLLPTQSAFRVL